MHRFVVAFLPLAALSFTAVAAVPNAAPPPFDPAKIPAVVARVNGREISRDRLLQEAEGARRQLVARGVAEASTRSRDFYAATLQQLIAGMLLEDEARAKGLTATDAEVDQQLARIRAQMPSGETFADFLAAQKLSEEELRSQIRQGLTIEKVVNAEVAPRIEVTEEAMRRLYQENQDRFRHPEEVRVAHILVKVAEGASEAEKAAARQKAEGLRQRALAGEDFAALARENSDDAGSRENGGELPWLAKGGGEPAFNQAVFALKVGGISPVVETRFGFHVVKLLARRPAGVAPFDEVKGSIATLLKGKEGKARLHDLVEELQGKARIDIYL